MSVLVNRDTRVLVQGITGKEGSFQTRRCIEYGTKVVAGVTPGRGGETAEGVPVFNTVSQAVRETGAECALIFVPPPFAADAILEAADAGVPLVVCITEGIPTLDMLKVKRASRAARRGSSDRTAPASSRRANAASARGQFVVLPLGSSESVLQLSERGRLASRPSSHTHSHYLFARRFAGDPEACLRHGSGAV